MKRLKNGFISVNNSPETIFDSKREFIVENYNSSMDSEITTAKFFVYSAIIGKYLLINNNYGKPSSTNQYLEILAITIYGKETGQNGNFEYQITDMLYCY